MFLYSYFFFFFFFNDTATTEIYTLSLHDALPIFFPFTCPRLPPKSIPYFDFINSRIFDSSIPCGLRIRSEEHTSELQSPCNLVCRLLLEKKKKIALLDATLHFIQPCVRHMHVICC